MAKSVKIYGRRFAELRERRHYSQEELARALGASRGTIANYEGRDVATMMPRLFRQLAELFGMSTEQLEREIAVNEPGSKDAMPFAPVQPADIAAVPPTVENSVPAYGQVSASSRGDFQAGQSPELMPAPPAEAAADLFCVTAYGQCLSPVVEDGDQAYVSRKAWEREGFINGKIYLVHLADGQSTLKMAFTQGAWVVLSPLEDGENKPMRLHRQQVAWAAKLQWVKKA